MTSTHSPSASRPVRQAKQSRSARSYATSAADITLPVISPLVLLPGLLRIMPSEDAVRVSRLLARVSDPTMQQGVQ